MTKLIFPAENRNMYIPEEAYTVTYNDKYKEFAYAHLKYLRDEKPELLNALLVIGELGNYLNLLGRLEMAMREFYCECREKIFEEDDSYTDYMKEMMQEEDEADIFSYFLYDEE